MTDLRYFVWGWPAVGYYSGPNYFVIKLWTKSVVDINYLNIVDPIKFCVSDCRAHFSQSDCSRHCCFILKNRVTVKYWVNLKSGGSFCRTRKFTSYCALTSLGYVIPSFEAFEKRLRAHPGAKSVWFRLQLRCKVEWCCLCWRRTNFKLWY